MGDFIADIVEEKHMHFFVITTVLRAWRDRNVLIRGSFS